MSEAFTYQLDQDAQHIEYHDPLLECLAIYTKLAQTPLAKMR